MRGRIGFLLGATLAASLPTATSSGEPGAPAEPEPYQIVDGAVDPGTYNGYRRYHAACNRCHGPDGSGSSFAPSLIETPLPEAAFRAIVLNGARSGSSVMPGFADDPNIAPHIEDIYAYLRARADGAIGRGRPAREP